ncbi:hypothetical protein CC86DRAFT_377925 [Ophiobolus disseminans]|uniref:Zn(2)-C6 fungal-type domain-containing protein n=1 Tax=Ophiobolus disseminans TaxID=1469910 RepID=A0A6A7ADP8_9PLEO|nr:hypothetical protein CC86DRAFT_377925 [Ophiobolus disseminans]
MSQRGRPSSAQSPGSQQRMPIEAAEALLWGKETHNEHVHLYGRMRELEEQHRDYDARIQATEAVVEAAEAATARVRRIEQRVVAIESDEQDRPFDKWAEGEISEFKNFIEKNKNVRQKQIELEEKVSHVEDAVDKVKDASKDVEILLERIGRLERDQISNANRIRSLETDVTNLTLLREDRIIYRNKLPDVIHLRATPERMLPPPSRQPNVQARDDSETEDENETLVDPPVAMQTEHDQVQVPRSPDVNANFLVAPGRSPSKGRGEVTARGRVMQRKSIHEPKRAREPERRPSQAPNHGSESQSRPRLSPLPPTQIINRQSKETSLHAGDASTHVPHLVRPRQLLTLAPRPPPQLRIQADILPATQLVSKLSTKAPVYVQNAPMQTTKPTGQALAPISKPRSRKQMEMVPPTQVVSRPIAEKPASPMNIPSITQDQERSRQFIVKLPTRKRKLDDTAPTPRLTRSQAKKSQDVIPVKQPTRTARVLATKEPARKRRKVNEVQAPPQVRSTAPALEIPNSDTEISSKATNLVKTSPRKAVTPTRRRRCIPCSKAHMPCDLVRPSCGSCKKRSQPGACVYTNPIDSQSQVATQMSSSPMKKKTTKPRALPKSKNSIKARSRHSLDNDEERLSPIHTGAGNLESPVRSSMARAGPEEPRSHAENLPTENRLSSKTLSAGKRTLPMRSSMSRENPYATPNAGTLKLTGPSLLSAGAAMPNYEDYKDIL